MTIREFIQLSILKPNSVSICPTEKMLCIVPLIQIVASSFITSRTKVSHCLLKSFTKTIPFSWYFWAWFHLSFAGNDFVRSIAIYSTKNDNFIKNTFYDFIIL